jgi:ubiquinone/menaquinone biosynthesis C-methylase UbiE
MDLRGYLMESDEESLRLDLKTDEKLVEKQALWAGINPGMRVADLGCGAGKTTFHLNKLVQPNGSTVGVDVAPHRIHYAGSHYGHSGIEYICRDIRQPLEDLGMFDFIWVRFVLEYYRQESFDIVKNISKILKPGGIMCLIDLDCNCMRHFGLSRRLETVLVEVMKTLEDSFNFDPYAGIKLYSYLYDLEYQDIDVNVTPHNLIFGELKAIEYFNFVKKVEMAAKISGYPFDGFKNGYEGFLKEFNDYFSDLRRFTYSPLISCRGIKTASRA